MENNDVSLGNSKFLTRVKIFFDLMMWISVFAMLWAFSTTYKPSDVTIYISIPFSILLASLFFYLVGNEKIDTKVWKKDAHFLPKSIFYVYFVIGYYLSSSYVFLYACHIVFGQNTQSVSYVVPIGETGRKIAYCSTTIRVIGVLDFLKNSYEAETVEHCASEKTYRKVLAVYSDGSSEKAKTFIAEYKSSLFGKEFIDANRHSELTK